MSYRAIVVILAAVVVGLGALLYKRSALKNSAPVATAAVSTPTMQSAPISRPQIDQTHSIESAKNSAPSASIAPIKVAPPASLPAPTPLATAEKIQPREIKSVQTFLKTFGEFAHPTSKPQNLVRELSSANLKPVVAQDFNKDTGKMLVIRTDETLPGTRYFHAQFFEDSNKQAFMQHMSFEFRPAPDNMQRAVELVKANFKNLKLIQSSDDYSLWKAPNDYIVWVKRMDKEELQNDPFNAHGPGDEGTVRVAIEVDQHGAEEDSAHIH